uniref:ARAD1B17006p n=1 Tax=Blastobotrys adeninivorans TaxID=409370 RepID=A0A060T674_BLAAD
MLLSQQVPTVLEKFPEIEHYDTQSSNASDASLDSSAPSTNYPSRTSTPRNSGAFGGDRKALFSRHPTVPQSGTPSNTPNGAPNSSSTSSFVPAGAQRRTRTRSLSQSGQEAIRQLAVPVSVPLVVICLSWYSTSAMSNTLNKSILNAFPYPVTLSMVQFILGVLFGLSTLTMAQRIPAFRQMLPKGFVSPTATIRMPTREILMATAPMGVFQLSGHIFSHMSTNLLPVSLVHTIKALSPLFTVAAYRFLFNVKYDPKTYLSLVPLTVGVIMTCSTEFRANFLGIVYALCAALIFVSQNMFSKKLLTPDDHSKLDKLNVLCYCSSLAFTFTSPLWLFSEGVPLIQDYVYGRTEPIGASLILAFVMNGLVHFLQNLLAFQVLGMVSPVTYSVASLIKRIVVISAAIVWFGQQVTRMQAWGILLTFAGLYLYDRAGGDRKRKYQQRSVLPK